LINYFIIKLINDNFLPIKGVLSIISGQGVFGGCPHAKNTRLPRFIEMIQLKVKKRPQFNLIKL